MKRVFLTLPVGLFLPALVLGCGGRTPPPQADPGRARGPPDGPGRLAAGGGARRVTAPHPAVHVADEDWQSGCRLVRYELAGADQVIGPHVRCPVVLALQDQRGRAVRKNVVYRVGTDPTLSIVREDL